LVFPISHPLVNRGKRKIIMKKIWFYLLVPLLIFSFSSMSYSSEAEHAGTFPNTQAVAGRILLSLEPGADLVMVLEELRKIGMEVQRASGHGGNRFALDIKSSVREISYLVLSIPANIPPKAAAKKAATLPGIKNASPDFIRRLFYLPDDPYYQDSQENMNQIGMERVWNVTFGDPGVIVAVLDTGYMASGLEDGAANLLDGYDFWGDDDDPTDYFGHGTLVSNVIAEITDNGIGAAGMAPGVSILPLKIFPDEEGGAEDSDIIDAVNFAVDNGAAVINMSFGGGDENPLFEEALINAHENGVFLVAATGNDGEDKIARPASYDVVFSVGSCDKHDFGEYPGVSKYSNYGQGLDIVAPGENIVQEGYTKEHGYAYYSAYGTSMSAPHVTAAVALMITLGGQGDVDELANILRETARSETDQWDQEFGYGELNVSGAISAYHEELPNSPPTAYGYANMDSGIVPETVLLYGDSSTDPDGNIVSYSWKMPDDTTSVGKVVQFEIVEAGQYQAELTVTDEEGETGSTIVSFELENPPPVKEDEEDEEEEKGCGCGASSGEKSTPWDFLFLGLAILFGATIYGWVMADKQCQK